MKILQPAVAGTLESSDAYIEISPSENGITIELESIVKQQFGTSIEKAVLSTLSDLEVKNAMVHIIDRGALECVIRARVETAVVRGGSKDA